MPSKPLAPHVQAAIARGQGVGVQPKAQGAVPERPMAAHVRQAVLGSLQPKMQAPIISGQPLAAHVQQAIARPDPARGSVQKADDAPRMITNPFQMPTLWDKLPGGRDSLLETLLTGLEGLEKARAEPQVPIVSWAGIAHIGARAPAPAPAPAGPTVSPITRLRQVILGDRDRLEKRANHLLERYETRSSGIERTVCFMWKLSHHSLWPPCSALSGGMLNRDERRRLRANPDKETTCAEENFLRTHGTADWKFSVAYDRQNGWKRACRAGCRDLLRHYRIVDLAGEFRNVAAAAAPAGRGSGR